MRYRRLGRTALQVSELCLGTMNFGPQTPEDESFAIMDRALELGINFFDTANRYGGDKGPGATESIIGRWFAQGGGRRDKVVLATKLFGAMSDWPNDGRLSARHIRDGLRRQPAPDADRPHRPLPDAPRRPHRAVGGGLAGDGHTDPAGQGHLRRQQQLRRLAHRPGQRGRRPLHTLGLVSEQSHYNLLVRTVELEVLPACREYGVGVIPWSPLSSGLLGGVLGDSERSRRQSPQSLRRIDKLRPKLEQWEKLCADLGEEPAAVALAWLLAQDGVTCPIIGPRTMLDQLDGASLRALDITLDARHAHRHRRDLPGPRRHRAGGLRLVARTRRFKTRPPRGIGRRYRQPRLQPPLPAADVGRGAMARPDPLVAVGAVSGGPGPPSASSWVSVAVPLAAAARRRRRKPREPGRTDGRCDAASRSSPASSARRWPVPDRRGAAQRRGHGEVPRVVQR